MHYLIGLHAVLGELSALAFLWVMVEMLSPTEGRIRRAKMIAGFGVILIFFFLPFLAIVVWGTLKQYGNDLIENKRDLARAIMILAGFIVLVAFSMAGMGYLISSGMRSALELKAL